MGSRKDVEFEEWDTSQGDALAECADAQHNSNGDVCNVLARNIPRYIALATDKNAPTSQRWLGLVGIRVLLAHKFVTDTTRSEVSDAVTLVCNSAELADAVVPLLNNENDLVSDVAAWIVTNVAAQTLSSSSPWVKAGCIQQLARLAESHHNYTRLSSAQAVWALGNMAPDHDLLPIIHNLNILALLMRLTWQIPHLAGSNHWSTWATNLSWALSNLVRANQTHSDPQPPDDDCQTLHWRAMFAVANRLLCEAQDTESLVYTSSLLKRIMASHESIGSRTKLFVELVSIPQLLHLMQHPLSEISTNAACVVCDIASADDNEYAHSLIDLGAIPGLLRLAMDKKCQSHVSITALGNLMSTGYRTQDMFSHEVFRSMALIIQDKRASFQQRFEAAWCCCARHHAWTPEQCVQRWAQISWARDELLSLTSTIHTESPDMLGHLMEMWIDTYNSVPEARAWLHQDAQIGLCQQLLVTSSDVSRDIYRMVVQLLDALSDLNPLDAVTSVDGSVDSDMDDGNGG